MATKKYKRLWIQKEIYEELKKLKEYYRRKHRKGKGKFNWKDFWNDVIWSIKNA